MCSHALVKTEVWVSRAHYRQTHTFLEPRVVTWLPPWAEPPLGLGLVVRELNLDWRIRAFPHHLPVVPALPAPPLCLGRYNLKCTGLGTISHAEPVPPSPCTLHLYSPSFVNETGSEWLRCLSKSLCGPCTVNHNGYEGAFKPSAYCLIGL